MAMISEIIQELSNRGIAYKGEVDGRHLFEGMGNRYKAAITLDYESAQDAITDVISRIGMRQPEWKDVGLEEVPDEDIERFVPMKEGPQGGLHVQVDGHWLRVRK